jgi:prepilin-type N-terminal cleavage/methylation domain-containing protein
MRTRNSLRKARSGFTLIEILVSVVVGCVIIIIIMNFMSNTLKTNAINTAHDTLLSDAEIGLDNINNTIRSSADADDNNRWSDPNAPGGSSSPYSWASNSNTLILATAAENSSQSILFSDPLNYVSDKNNNIYFVSNGILYQRVLAAPVTGNVAVTTCPASDATSACPADGQLMHNVQSFSVSYLDGNGNVTATPSNARAIKLSVTLQEVVYDQTLTATYTTRTVFRNE